MNELSFDDRVVVVTGAGRGIGRAYAELLAARGASVVVNDLGTSMGGRGTDVAPANEVVAQIRDRGGVAVADGNDVSGVEGAEALVATALEHFGRLDALINNAGIMKWATMPEIDLDTLQRHLDVHLIGSFNTARAAWPHFVEQGRGRIVMTTSAGMLGHPANLAYAAAKGGVVGLMRALAASGRGHDIAVNAVAPVAETRMAGQATDSPPDSPMAPELVAPLVAYLCHDACPVSGEIYAAGAGRFSRMVIATTEGYLGGHDTMIDDIAQNWAAIDDTSTLSISADLLEWSAEFTRHLHAAD